VRFAVSFVVVTLSKLSIVGCGFTIVSPMICKLARNCGVANFDETGERDGMGGGRSGLI